MREIVQTEIRGAIPIIVSSLDAKIKEKVDEETQVLHRNVKDLKIKDEMLDHKIVKCEMKMTDEMKRKNLIIHGLGTLKSWKEREIAVFNFLQVTMGVQCKNEDIDNIIKLDKTKNDGPILVKFTTTRKKMEILSNRKSLKNTNIYIDEDFSKETVEKRKEMKKIMKQLKSEGKKDVYLKRDKLWVDGALWTDDEIAVVAEAKDSDATDQTDVEMEGNATPQSERKKGNQKRIRSPSDAAGNSRRTKKLIPKSQSSIKNFFSPGLEQRPRSSSVGANLGPVVANIVDKFTAKEAKSQSKDNTLEDTECTQEVLMSTQSKDMECENAGVTESEAETK